jgi:hypothetical protein
MEIILNITVFALSVTGCMLVYIGYHLVKDIYQQHKIDKMYDKYERMCEDGSIELPDDWLND